MFLKVDKKNKSHLWSYFCNYFIFSESSILFFQVAFLTDERKASKFSTHNRVED